MIVVSMSGTCSIEYHGSYYETHQITDGKVHLWVWGIDGQQYDVYASEDVPECKKLHKAMIAAHSAGKPIFSVATRVNKIREESREKVPARDPNMDADHKGISSPAKV